MEEKLNGSLPVVSPEYLQQWWVFLLTTMRPYRSQLLAAKLTGKVWWKWLESMWKQLPFWLLFCHFFFFLHNVISDCTPWMTIYCLLCMLFCYSSMVFLLWFNTGRREKVCLWCFPLIWCETLLQSHRCWLWTESVGFSCGMKISCKQLWFQNFITNIHSVVSFLGTLN